MKTIRLTLSFFAAAMGALVAAAQQAPVEAVVASFVGAVTVTAPGATVAVPAVIGQKLPEGSTVTTAEDATVLIQSYEGIQTGVGPKSTAIIGTHSVNAEGIRTAVIDLKAGTTISVLDPSKRKINNYGVRTPKGVAAARGTTYSTTFDGVTVTVDTITGEVSFAVSGGSTVSVGAGTSTNSSTGKVSTLTSSNVTAAQKEALLLTIKVVAIIAQAFPAEAGRLAAVIALAKNVGITDVDIDTAQITGDVRVAKASGDTEKKNEEFKIKTSTLDISIVSPSS
jgi:hypothetical protein